MAEINGEAVYGSRPFETWGYTTACYTRNNGKVYATLLNWDGNAVTLNVPRTGATLGKVSKVELLDSTVELGFTQNEQGLTITPLLRRLGQIPEREKKTNAA